jgi:hypothetical protein
VLEYIPKSTKWEEWPRKHAFGLYISDAEPRPTIDHGLKPLVHRSVVDRRKLSAEQRVPEYSPVNLPADFDVEPPTA